jgi:hypothetical protein
MTGSSPRVCAGDKKAQISSTDSMSHQDTTNAALRRKNQSKLAGLRQSQAPRQAAALADKATDAKLAVKRMLNILQV